MGGKLSLIEKSGKNGSLGEDKLKVIVLHFCYVMHLGAVYDILNWFKYIVHIVYSVYSSQAFRGFMCLVYVEIANWKCVGKCLFYIYILLYCCCILLECCIYMYFLLNLSRIFSSKYLDEVK